MDRIAFDFPLGLIAGLPLVAVLLALSAWLQRRRGVAAKQLALSLLLRGVALVLLAVLAARPVLTDGQEKRGKTVVLLADRSASMSLDDRGATRFAHLLAFARGTLLPALNRADLPARAFLFAEETSPAVGAELAAAVPDGPKTDLAGALLRALAGGEELPLAAIALTDGAANVQRDNGRALSALLESGVDFVGIGFGSESDLRTLALRRVLAPSSAPPGEEFYVSAQLELNSAAELPPCDLLLLRDGRLLEKKTIAPGKGQRLWLESFAVREEKGGEYSYMLQLQPPAVEGLKCLNRVAVAQVRILKAKEMRVLFAQGELTWDYKYVRLALRGDPGIKLTGLTRTSTNSYFYQDIEAAGELTRGFPTAIEELAPFSVVVLAGFKPGDLSPSQQELLLRFCGEFGGGVLVIGGPETFDASWQKSPLERLLPVRLSAARAREAAKASFQLQPTEEALSQAVFQIADGAAQRSAWAQLPPFSGGAEVEGVKPGATIWAVQAGTARGDTPGRVVIAQQRYGGGISAAICLRNLWQWRLAKNSMPQQFDRFWRQLLRYLCEGSREELEIHFPDQDLRPKSDVRFVLRRRPDARNPQGERDYQVKVQDDRQQPLKQQKVALAGDKAVELSFQPASAGVYTVAVADGMGAPQGSRTIEIKDTSLEFQRPARDMDALRHWAELTGGIAVRAEDCTNADELVAHIRERAGQPRRTERRIPLGVNGWMLGAVLGCLCAEWVLRKRWGMR